MKVVSEIITQRLKSLPNTFSPRWILEFKSLFTFLNENQSTKKIIDEISEEKFSDHTPLIQALRRCLADEKRRLPHFQKKLKNFPALSKQLGPKIQALNEMTIDEQQLNCPFFELERIFIQFRERYEEVARDLIGSEICPLILPSASAYCPLHTQNVEISVSFKHMDEVQREIEILASRRKASLWGQWDILLQWRSWLEDGGPTSSDALTSNLTHVFKAMQVPVVIQCVAQSFIEKLANYSIDDRESCPYEVSSLRSLELFLDNDDQYWIILRNETGYPIPIFIKRVYKDLPSHTLLKKLLSEEPSTIKLQDVDSHTLGEIKLKDELRKLFFPEGTFVGPYVEFNEFTSITVRESILNKLLSLHLKKKSSPSFSWVGYHKSKGFS